MPGPPIEISLQRLAILELLLLMQVSVNDGKQLRVGLFPAWVAFLVLIHFGFQYG